jgi:hypothetical protein
MRYLFRLADIWSVKPLFIDFHLVLMQILNRHDKGTVLANTLLPAALNWQNLRRMRYGTLLLRDAQLRRPFSKEPTSRLHWRLMLRCCCSCLSAYYAYVLTILCGISFTARYAQSEKPVLSSMLISTQGTGLALRCNYCRGASSCKSLVVWGCWFSNLVHMHRSSLH